MIRPTTTIVAIEACTMTNGWCSPPFGMRIMPTTDETRSWGSGRSGGSPRPRGGARPTTGTTGVRRGKITHLTGDNILAGIFVHRLLALAGVALIVWSLPRLAGRCGVAPVSALWLGAANPLLLFHLVAGVHNEALMLGLMLAGVELALRGVYSGTSNGPIPPARVAASIAAGTALIALSATIKLPSLLALGFVGDEGDDPQEQSAVELGSGQTTRWPVRPDPADCESSEPQPREDDQRCAGHRHSQGRAGHPRRQPECAYTLDGVLEHRLCACPEGADRHEYSAGGTEQSYPLQVGRFGLVEPATFGLVILQDHSVVHLRTWGLKPESSSE